MKNFILLFIFSIQIIFLSSCELVHSTDTKQEEKSPIIYAYILEVDGGEKEYYSIHVNFNYPEQEDLYPSSAFFYGGTISTIISDTGTEEKINTNYYLNLDTFNCLNISMLMYHPDTNTFTTSEKEKYCDITSVEASYESNDRKYSSYFKVNLVDIDYLQSLEVIQFDSDNQKIQQQFYDLENLSTISILPKTVDFLIVEKYQDKDGNIYYKRTLKDKKTLENKYYTPWDIISALDQSGNRVRYMYNYEFLEESEGSL